MDGYIVYQGYSSANYFAKIGYPMPGHGNPSDFFLRTLQVNYPKTDEDNKKVKHLCDEYSKHVEPTIFEDSSRQTFSSNTGFEQQPHTFCYQLSILNWRNKILMAREPMVVKVKIG